MCATSLPAAVLMHAAPVRPVCRFLQVPFICDLKPSGKYVMEDMHKVTTLGRGTRQGARVVAQAAGSQDALSQLPS